ncbi:hypothetical protein H6P81_005443 [Aristolochia fimbriata]|uniref:non-specific serine/threonine protein kinase n=1 Tax=Aristolochia fimbriata TaxID=158543 RepID=A0AAV7EVM9_ARIFI|nr:hypothetical protein H6P81_005443 [Aristolochia fimbriata]
MTVVLGPYIVKVVMMIDLTVVFSISVRADETWVAHSFTKVCRGLTDHIGLAFSIEITRYIRLEETVSCLRGVQAPPRKQIVQLNNSDASASTPLRFPGESPFRLLILTPRTREGHFFQSVLVSSLGGGMEERYEPLKELGSGNFGVARLVRDKKTKELVAVKYIERGKKIDENVQREIINHRSLRHPNIVRFKEVLLTPTHLAIVMEYAAGGELFERICSAGRFSEDEARFFFQQLISGVSYCHTMEICHRDLKLENTLLDGSPTPRLKICDFGYSKSALLHSQPKSTVGTPAYIAPEVLSRKEYDGKIADVWSCGVTLYVMLVGAYPFEDPEDPRNFRKTIGRIMSVQYSIPDYVRISADCRHLLSRIFVANPSKRITIPEIKKHPWFLKNLPKELVEGERTNYESMERDQPSQSTEEIMRIIQEARTPAVGVKTDGQSAAGNMDVDEVDTDADAEEEVDYSGDLLGAGQRPGEKSWFTVMVGAQMSGFDNALNGRRARGLGKNPGSLSWIGYASMRASTVGISISFPIRFSSDQELSSGRFITSARQIHLPFERLSLSIKTSDGFPGTGIRMGGGPRTYPGGVSKWQWKRMQAKKAKQLLKARLCRERQIYEMRKRAELRAAVAELEKPWEVVERAPTLFSVKADEQLKALADRFQRPGGNDLWSDRDGPRLFHNQDELPSARFFPKGALHSLRPYGLIDNTSGRSGDSQVSNVEEEDFPKTKWRQSSGRGRNSGRADTAGDGKIIDLYPTSSDLVSEGAGDSRVWESREETGESPDGGHRGRNAALERGPGRRRQGRLPQGRSTHGPVSRNYSDRQSPSSVAHPTGVPGGGRDRNGYDNAGNRRTTGNGRGHRSPTL